MACLALLILYIIPTKRSTVWFAQMSGLNITIVDNLKHQVLIVVWLTILPMVSALLLFPDTCDII